MENTLNTFLLFYIFCFAGWVWESCYMSVIEKKLINRGFLNGPYIPIYGFGGIAIYFMFQKYSTTLFSIYSIYIYIAGCIFATILEYITSYLLEKIFKARWWDYSNDPFNLNGRICLVSSLFWGVLSVSFVQLVNPFLLVQLNLLSHDAKLIIVTAITTTIAIDTSVTVSAIINLQQKITAIIEFESKKLSDVKEKIAGLSDLPAEYKQIIIDYKNKLYNINNPFTKRLIKAFPKLKFLSTEQQSVFVRLKNIKDNIMRKK